MNRRTFLGVAAGLTLADAGAQTPPSMPIIDTHIHLFDTERPGGVPWPSKNNHAFTPLTTPSSRSQMGGGLPVNLTNIRQLADGRIIFQIGYDYE